MPGRAESKFNNLLYLIFAVVVFTICCGDRPFGPEVIPSNAWRTSTPEAQGLDSATLQEAGEAADRLGYVNGLLVVRNGYLVMERYFNGYDRDDPHLIQSVTKSFLSAMVGIALRDGYLDSLDQRIIEFFPEFDTPDLDERKRDITIRHLLTMQAGFDHDHNIFFQVYYSADWVHETWNLPLISDPGDHFAYNTFEPHLLSVILTRTTGMSTYQFAQSALFSPLGIQCRGWEQDPQGYYFGGAGMWLTPRDMARLGYLYLRNGNLGGQIVPQEWVEESLQDQVGADHWEWGELEELGYGFLWWLGQIDGYEAFTALGHGGQYILCVPQLEMIVVTASFSDVDWETADEQERAVQTIIAEYVLPAVIDSGVTLR
jgi:CubicO group peptidase (beta-lactamase class C family)